MDNGTGAEAGGGEPRKEPALNRWGLALAGALSLLLVAGAAFAMTSKDQPSPGPGRPSATLSSAQLYEQQKKAGAEIAARRTTALLAGDETGWLADIDPAATAVVAFERLRFRNLRLLQPEHFRLFFTGTDMPVAWEGGQVHTYLVRQALRLPSDVATSASFYQWKIDFRGERPLITASAGHVMVDQVDRTSDSPWDDVPLRVAQGAGVTVVAAEGGRWDPAAYLPATQRARQLVSSLWARRKGATDFIVFLGDEQQFRTWFGVGDVEHAIGVATFPLLTDDDGAHRRAVRIPTASRVDPLAPRYQELTAGARISMDMSKIPARDFTKIAAHEMAHALGPHLLFNLQLNSDPKTPGNNQARWVIEGFARYVEHLAEPGSAQRGADYVRRNMNRFRPARTFPTNADFYTEGERTNFNYELGAAFFLAAEKVGGRQKAADLYLALCNSTERELTDGPLNVTLTGAGLDPARLAAAYRDLIS